MGRMEGATEGTDSVVSVSAVSPQPLGVLWQALMELIRQQRPTEAQINEANGAASLALALVNQGDIDPHGPMSDVAQAASLYGYVLGMQQGRQQASARI